MRTYRVLTVAAVTAIVLALIPATAAQAAVAVTRAELKAGQLRVEGSGALASHAVTVSPGGVTGESDAKGRFTIQAAGYASPTCRITVGDGSTTSSVGLAGCTPTTPPTAPPAGSGLTFSPTSMTFAPQNSGTQSPAQVLTVTNHTASPVFISGDRFTGDFHGADNCVSLSIAAGASCTVDVIVIPTSDGALTGTFTMTDTAPNSPQVLTLPGTGAGTGTGPTPLLIHTEGLTCTAAGCDLGAGFAFTAANFYLKNLLGQGGTMPYTWSATGVPAGMTLDPTGFLYGTLPAPGTYPISVRLADSAGASTIVRFTQPIPAPGDPGCQHAPTVGAALTAGSFGGSGSAQEDNRTMTSCGGYGTITVSLRGVNLPNGTVLTVSLDGGAIGTITVTGGAGAMKPFVTGQFLRFDSISVNRGAPPVAASGAPVVSGGPFQ